MAAVIDIYAKLQAQGLDQFTQDMRRKLQGVTANVDVRANGSGLTRLTGAASASEKALRGVKTQAALATTSLISTLNVTGQVSVNLSNLAAQAGLTSRRFLAFASSVGLFLKVADGIKRGVADAVKFDLAMNKLGQVSGDTAASIAEVRDEVRRLSTSLGVSGTELANVAVTFKQAGLSAREVKQALEAVALTDLAPNFDSMAQSTEGLIAVFRQFGVSAGSFKQVMGSINAVAGDFAVEAGDIVTAVQKAGGAFAAVAGQTKTGIEALAEFQGLFTSVRATTRESADSIATGLRTIFTRFQRADTVQALKEYGVNLRYTAEEAKALGDVNLTDQFVGAYEAVRRLSTGLSGLRETDARFAAVIEQLGGYRQVSKVLPLLKQQEEAQKAVNTALAGQISLELAAEKRQGSLANKVDVLREKYLDLFRRLVGSSGFQTAADQLLKLAGSFTRVLDAASPLVPVITALAGVKIAANIGNIAKGFGGAFAAPVGSLLRRGGGGSVPGFGSTDSVPSLLTPGEFVINKASASRLGASTLNRLNRYNSGGFVHRFAGGGAVPAGSGGRDLSLSDIQEESLKALLKSGIVERVIASLEKGRSGKYVQRAGNEALSAAYDGLIRAIQKYDPSKGASLETYAYGGIRQSVTDAVNAFFGKDGAKSGPSGFDARNHGSREREPIDKLIEAEKATAQALRVSKVQGVLGGALPSNYREFQKLTIGVGLKGNGSEDVLVQRLADHVAANIGRGGGSGGGGGSSGGGAGGGGPIDLSKFRFGSYQVLEKDLVQFANFIKLNTFQFESLLGKVKALGVASGRFEEFLTGQAKVIVGFDQNRRPKPVGFSGGPSFVLGPGRLGLTDPAASNYQEQVLAAAKASQGRRLFGVGADDLTAADRLRVERGNRQAGVDPLLTARENRSQRLLRLRSDRVAAESVDAARAAGVNALKAANFQQARDTKDGRLFRDAFGVGGVTDPLQIKQAAIRAFENGEGGYDVLNLVRPHLSPAQYRQVEFAAGRSGFGIDFTKTTRESGPSLLSRLKSNATGLASTTALKFGALREGAGKFIGRFNESRFGRIAGGFGGGAALLGVPLLADQIAPGGEARDSTVYRARAGAAGALQSAVLGGAAGAGLGGPFGAAIGAVGGGLLGLVSSLREAEQAIRDVKIGNALTTFQDRLGTLSNLGSSGTSAAAIAEATKSVRDALAVSAEKNKAEATHTFGGFDVGEFSDLQRKSLRNDFGGQLAQIATYLQRDAEKLGRSSVGKSVDDLTKTITEANGGLNKELISVVANLRNIPIAQVEQDIRKNILAGQRAAVVERTSLLGGRAEERNVQDFGRFLLAIEASEAALFKLKQGAESVSQVFEGFIGASRVTARADNLERFGALDRSALAPLRTVSAAVGGKDAGLLAMGKAVDDLERNLPGAISAAIAKGPTNPDASLAVDVIEQLKRQLGDSPANRRALDSLVKRLEEETTHDKGGAKNLFDQAGTDVTALSKKLLQGISDPLKEVAGKAAKQFEDNANLLTEGLSTVANRVRQIGELYDQVALVQEQKFRTSLSISAERAGRGNQALDFASLGQLEAGFNARQSRLGGSSGFDPSALGQQLSGVLSKLEDATSKQQEVFEQTGGRGPQFKAAADEVVRLKTSAANLQQALKNLADVSTRNASVLEKLTRIQQEREGRLGLAERYATTSPDESVRLNRGFLLANQANNQGGLNGFTADDRRLIVETLRLAGGTTLTGFNGAPRADDLLKKLLEGFGGGAFKLNPQQALQERALQGIQLDRTDTAEKALGELIKFQEKASDTFFKNLLAQQNAFFDRLGAFFNQQKVADKQNQLGNLAGEQNRLGGLAKQRGLLAAVGVTTSDQVKALQGKRGDLDAIQAAYQTRSAIAGSYGDVSKRFAGVDANALFKGGIDYDKVQTQLVGLGLTNDQSGKVSEQFRKIANQADTATGRAPELAHLEDPEVRKKQLQRAIQQQLISELDAQSKTITEKTRGLDAIKGVNANKVSDALGGNGAADFLKALDTFSGGQKLEGLQAEIDKTAKAFAQLNAELAALKAGQQGGGAVVRKAAGGMIGFHPGGPRGSDTVPAWLTPGEFVVNARAARANLSLLKGINEGVAFRASGGRIGLEDERRFLARSELYGESALQQTKMAVAREYLARSGKQQRSLDDTVAGAVGAVNQRFEAYASGRRTALAQGLSRAGDEGQRAVAARVFGLQEDRARSVLKNDPYFQRFLGVRQFAAGGVVPGVGSADTVPALLTPGEFVLNKLTAQAVGLGRLHHLNKGGVVKYLSGGSDSLIAAATNQSSVALVGEGGKPAGVPDLSAVAASLSSAFNVFAGNATALTAAINNMPKSLSISGQHQVVVTLNGAEAIARITPELRTMVTNEVQTSLRRVFKEQLPDAGVRVN